MHALDTISVFSAFVSLVAISQSDHRKSFTLQPVAQRRDVLRIPCLHDTMHRHRRNIIIDKRAVVRDIDLIWRPADCQSATSFHNAKPI